MPCAPASPAPARTPRAGRSEGPSSPESSAQRHTVQGWHARPEVPVLALLHMHVGLQRLQVASQVLICRP